MRNTTWRFFNLFFILILLASALFFIQKIPELFKKEKKAIGKLDKNAVNKIVITDEKDKIVINKKNNRWLINNFPADKNRVDKIIESLLDLKKEEVVSSNKNKYTSFAVEGKRKIALDNHIVYIGKTYSYGKSYFRVNDDTGVYVAEEDLSSLFYPKDFRDLKVYFINNEDRIDGVKEEWGGKLLKLTKKNDNWLVFDNKAVKKEKADFFINDIKTLKGDDVFDKKSLDLSNYSVDLTVVVSEGGKEKKGVFYQKNKEKYYFYQEGSSYIYQIPAAYVSSLKKEEKDLVE